MAKAVRVLAVRKKPAEAPGTEGELAAALADDSIDTAITAKTGLAKAYLAAALAKDETEAAQMAQQFTEACKKIITSAIDSALGINPSDGQRAR